jgi:hypothetical protein
VAGHLLSRLLLRVWTSIPPPDQNGPLQPNALGVHDSNEPPISLMRFLDTGIPQNAPLPDRVAVLDKVTKLMEFTKPQVSAFSQVKLPTFSGNDNHIMMICTVP